MMRSSSKCDSLNGGFYWTNIKSSSTTPPVYDTNERTKKIKWVKKKKTKNRLEWGEREGKYGNVIEHWCESHKWNCLLVFTYQTRDKREKKWKKEVILYITYIMGLRCKKKIHSYHDIKGFAFSVELISLTLSPFYLFLPLSRVYNVFDYALWHLYFILLFVILFSTYSWSWNARVHIPSYTTCSSRSIAWRFLLRTKWNSRVHFMLKKINDFFLFESEKW